MKPLLTRLLILLALPAAQAAESQPNVLMIAVDDLRPTLGCYGDKIARTPNIDAMAKRGLIFQRAYCQQAVCAVSRLSLLTGRRPDTMKVWDLGTGFRKTLPNISTLPQYFKENGYHTQSIGKVLHGSGPASVDAQSWSQEPIMDRRAKLRYVAPTKGLKGKSFEAPNVGDNAYSDGLVADAASEKLKEYAKSKKPFFLAVGFRKPHLPFNAPKKYWDLYQRDQFTLPTAHAPKNAPELAMRSWLELEGYKDIPRNLKKEPLTPEHIAELRHGYYACVSYIDTLIGKVLTTLDKQNLSKNTIIVLWSDHGYHLGEQTLWTKANNYELSTRVPMIICSPQHATHAGTTKALSELVDLYPTLVELSNLKRPDGLEGTSLAPLLANPQLKGKPAAFSQWPRHKTSSRHRSHGNIMGYAMRTDRYRYIEWIDWKTKEVLERELYDHSNDSSEMNNIANQPEQQKEIQQLSKQLQSGWRPAQTLQNK